jgi:hypothetical protein
MGDHLMSAEAILKDLRDRQIKLRVSDQGDLLISDPSKLDDNLRARVRAEKPQIVEVLLRKRLGTAHRAPLSNPELADLATFLPHFCTSVGLPDGRRGVVWGASGHGVAVLTSGIILTLAPSDVLIDVGGSP